MRLVQVIVACGVMSQGCESNLIQEQRLSSAELPHAIRGATNASWESSGWKGNWVAYPKRTQLTLEHGMRRVPSLMQAYLAFDQEGTDAALAAGDLLRIVEMTDTTVTVLNNGDADYFIRVVLY